MKNYQFRASTDFGGDGYTYFEVELTEDENNLLLEVCSNKENVEIGFSECDELSELYNKIYPYAVKAVTEELIDSGEVDLDELEEEARENGDISDDEEYVFSADEMYSITIHFPEDFE